jgi:hypothetical protein
VLWIATRVAVDETLQIVQQRLVGVNTSLGAGAGLAHPPRRQLRRLVKVARRCGSCSPQAHWRALPLRSRRGHATVPQPQPTLTLV